MNRALVVLSGLQQADGGYKCFGVANLESIAQVIMVLCTLGIDPLADPRFVKNDALCSQPCPATTSTVVDLGT